MMIYPLLVLDVGISTGAALFSDAYTVTLLQTWSLSELTAQLPLLEYAAVVAERPLTPRLGSLSRQLQQAIDSVNRLSIVPVDWIYAASWKPRRIHLETYLHNVTLPVTLGAHTEHERDALCIGAGIVSGRILPR